jgi:hypothetical protein
MSISSTLDVMSYYVYAANNIISSYGADFS